LGKVEEGGSRRCVGASTQRASDVLTRLQSHAGVEWEPLDHAGAQEIVSKIFDSDGGEDVRLWLGDSGEVRFVRRRRLSPMAYRLSRCFPPVQPIVPQAFTSRHPAMTIHESWQVRSAPERCLCPLRAHLISALSSTRNATTIASFSSRLGLPRPPAHPERPAVLLTRSSAQRHLILLLLISSLLAPEGASSFLSAPL
jgi:hypothetical protein